MYVTNLGILETLRLVILEELLLEQCIEGGTNLGVSKILWLVMSVELLLEELLGRENYILGC